MEHRVMSGPDSLTRRELLRTGAITTVGFAAACAPAAQAPAVSETGPATGGPGGDWRAQWDALVAAAKKEGQLVVQLPLGTGFRTAL